LFGIVVFNFTGSIYVLLRV